MVPLFEHQRKIIEENKKVVGLFLGTGSGKTRTAVALATGLTLVICPKTQAIDGTWTNEWLAQGKRVPLIVVGKEQFRIRIEKEGYEAFGRPETVILDECHTLCGVTPYTRQKKHVKYPKTSLVFMATVAYLRWLKPKRIYPLSATPDAEPMKIWGVAKILGADWDFFKFREIFYFSKEVRGRLLYLVLNSTENKRVLGKTVQSLGYVGRLNDWFDVPEQTFKVHNCGVTKAQEDMYRELQLEYPDPNILVGKIHQLEQGVVKKDEFKNGRIQSVVHSVKETKLQALDLYQQEFKKIVIFARYTAQIELYKSYFEKKKIKVYVLNGKTKDSIRKEQTTLAGKTHECVFIAQSAVSAGWELPNFPVMIFASLDTSFVNYDQAIGRIQRANNIKKNLYVFLIAGNVDKKRKQLIDNKQSFSEAKFAKEFGKELATKKSMYE